MLAINHLIFSTQTTASTLTEGANALKLDNEVQEPVINETSHSNKNVQDDNSINNEIVENNVSNETETKFSFARTGRQLYS